MHSLARIFPTTADLSVDVLYVDSDVALGARDNLFMILWRDRTTHEGVELLARVLGEYTRNRAQDLGIITVIEPTAKMPEAGTRHALARTLRDVSSKVLISGLVFGGDGFVAASIRSVVVGLTLLARQTYPHRVFRSLEEASRWFESERLPRGRPFLASEVLEAVAALRRRAYAGRAKLPHPMLQTERTALY